MPSSLYLSANEEQSERRRDVASQRLLAFLPSAILSALRAGHNRLLPPAPPRWPEFPSDAKKRLLIVKGISSTSESPELRSLAELLPDYSPCEFSYRGAASPIYDEKDTANALLNIPTAARLIDDYLPPDDVGDRIVVAHSLGGIIAQEWAWLRQSENEERPDATRLFFVASPIRVRSPQTTEITLIDERLRLFAPMMRGPTYPPDLLPDGVSDFAACFCRVDALGAQPLCRLPDSPLATNFPPLNDADHMTICDHDTTKSYFYEQFS